MLFMFIIFLSFRNTYLKKNTENVALLDSYLPWNEGQNTSQI